MKIIIIILILFTPITVWGKRLNYGPYEAKVISVYDGDTFTAEIYIWPNTIKKVSIRLIGVDTPEIRAKCKKEKKKAIAAKKFLEDKILDKRVLLTDVKIGKYAGRFLASVNIIPNGDDITDLLIAAKHGRVYTGGKRKGWCKIMKGS